MKNKILKIFLTTIAYIIPFTVFGYRDNIHDVLLPTYITFYILINVFMMDKSKSFFENFLTLSGVMCLVFLIALFLKGTYKPLVYQYFGLMFISSILVYYLKKNFNLINSQN